MMMKIRNNQVQSEAIVQQMKEQWIFYNQSPSGRLLGVELDYLLHLEVSPHWTPVPKVAAMPPVKCTLQGGSKGGGCYQEK